MPEPQYTLFPNTPPKKKSPRPPRSQKERDYDTQRGKTPERKAAAKEWKVKNSERVAMVMRTAQLVHRALRQGLLVKAERCEECGVPSTKLQAAHSDYSKPLDVRWLCSSCHSRWDQIDPKTLTIVPPNYGRKPHDERRGYVLGCKCDKCREHKNAAQRRQRRERRERQEAGIPKRPKLQAVQQLDMNGIFIAEFESITAGATAVGQSTAATIHACLVGRVRHAHGFIWRRVDGANLVTRTAS